MLDWEGAGRARGGHRGDDGVALGVGWWCRGLHGEGVRWRRIGRDEVTSCGKCILQAARCNAGVGRASSFGPFLDRIGSSGTGLHSNLLRSRQASGPMAMQKRHADRKHGPASQSLPCKPWDERARAPLRGREGPGVGVKLRDQGCIAAFSHLALAQDCSSAGPLMVLFRRGTCAPPRRLMKAKVPGASELPPCLQGPAAQYAPVMRCLRALNRPLDSQGPVTWSNFGTDN
jgi:hypothetical protein